MDETIKLLKVIGSPFVANDYLPKSSEEAIELYSYATKNKIGLLYLEALERNDIKWLNQKYEIEKRKYKEILVTAFRIGRLLNNLNVNYAIFKSIPLYPYVPNDVDVVVFNDYKFKEIVQQAIKNGYEFIGESPLEVWLHDLRKESHKTPKEKDIFDVDLYREIGAFNIIYIDKAKIQQFVCTRKLFEENVKVLNPEAELATLIMHSIFPEQIFTLNIYYATLFYLKNMNNNHINLFLKIIQENNLEFATKKVLSIIAFLHLRAHNFVPNKLEVLLTNLGLIDYDKILREYNTIKIPYHYKISTIIFSIIEKFKEDKCAKSIVKQIVSLFNPNAVIYVGKVIIERRKRETY